MAAISDQEKEFIRDEARNFLNGFSRKLDKLPGDLGESFESFDARKEDSGWVTSEDFKETMFANAPIIEGDLIVAETGKWKK